MRYTFTAVFVDGEDGWIVSYIEEVPGVHGQGRTIDEARQSLREAMEMILDSNRERTAGAFRGARIVKREAITVGDGSRRLPRGRGQA